MKNVFESGPFVVEKGQCRPELVGPIAAGETHEMAVARMERTFDKTVAKYAFEIFDEPLVGENQQFETVIGTVWCQCKEKK